MREKELREFLADMSLEEKIGQMVQVVGGLFAEDATITGPMQEMGFTQELMGQVGSVLGTFGADTVKEIQRKYMEKQPHHIPLLFMLDVINGFRTVFPIPLGQGATFEPELSEKCAQAAAKESAASGVHVTFAPMTDLVRDARWGRVMESTGEDPYLNSLFCAAMVKGFQGDDLRAKGNIAACVKHFAGYGGATAGRDYNTVELSDHTLREFYLPSYKAGIDAGAALVMTSFNTLGGVPSTGNKYLMRDILRDEFGFDGVLISDWAAIEEMIYHGYCADGREAAKRAAVAGVDIDMMTGCYAKNLCALVRDGEITEEAVDEAVYRILELKNRLGLFEHPYKDADGELEREVILCDANRKLAREAAVKSFVLLKNEGALPLEKDRKTAFIGPYTDNRNLMGSWSIIGKPEDVGTLREALAGRFGAGAQADGGSRYGRGALGQERVAAGAQAEGQDALADGRISFYAGSPVLGNSMKVEGFLGSAEEPCSDEDAEAMLAEAVAAAKEAEQVVLALGEHYLQSGEAKSSGIISLPEIQLRLFREVCAVNDNVTVVLFSGRPLDLREISQKAKAILEVWWPGTEGAAAIADVLYGASSPSGKLPMSFPYCVGQAPVHYNEYSTGRPHHPGEDKDFFRSRYLDIPNKPLYPFGYGLTYTSFSISPVKLDRGEMTRDGQITARVTVKNTGSRPGTETIQLYLHDIAASVVRPVRELKGFQKVELQPGEEREIGFTITDKELVFLTENGRWESEPGEFEVFIGNDSTTENAARFRLL